MLGSTHAALCQCLANRALTDAKSHRLFSDAKVIPLSESVGKLISSNISCKESVTLASAVIVSINIMATALWTKEQTKLAFHLYCQIPYGRIYGRNPEIVALAKAIGRTADAVAMKMLNIASIDPSVRSTGRAGLGNASALDCAIWDEFHSDWERLALECQSLSQQLNKDAVADSELDGLSDELSPQDFTGANRQVVIEQRIKQHFFRRAVLSSYRGRCCMSGLSDSRMLIASHIVPWSRDKANRLNPSNGLCLSAIHDCAFDKGLISITKDFRVVLSDDLRTRDETFVKAIFLPLENSQIEMPERFRPDPAFLALHRTDIFLGANTL